MLMTHGLWTPLRLILIQHANERARPTGTARLLSDPRLAMHLHVERWTWRGRNDASSIAKRLADLSSSPELVWADPAGGCSAGFVEFMGTTLEDASGAIGSCKVSPQSPPANEALCQAASASRQTAT